MKTRVHRQSQNFCNNIDLLVQPSTCLFTRELLLLYEDLTRVRLFLMEVVQNFKWGKKQKVVTKNLLDIV